MKFAQIVIGPAGCGKSTYASKMREHLIDSKRDFCMVNLDPAAEDFLYVPDIDIRELVSLEDVMEMEDLKLGPNGGLIFCIEYLIENIGWLLGKIDSIECDYLIFDCPGQIELYTHMTAFQTLFKCLQKMDFSLCVMYMMDSQFMVDPCKFIGGVLSALSSMVMFEVPHINVLTKIDLLDPYMKSRLDELNNYSFNPQFFSFFKSRDSRRT
ncbi:hypothetical protein MXB_2606 [Myxobolus squamalis]|nr:hypothetical protein MXB_2606 [Myxobolus squamalis]